ncbi:hypothetical protein TNCV_708771 [Trichonephila clavipes]|nr:hypothetical protein TNCV_708771 [Trichonephila clavipes]
MVRFDSSVGLMRLQGYELKLQQGTDQALVAPNPPTITTEQQQFEPDNGLQSCKSFLRQLKIPCFCRFRINAPV